MSKYVKVLLPYAAYFRMNRGAMINEIIDWFSGHAAHGTVKRPLLTMAIVNVTSQIWFGGQLETANFTIVDFFHISKFFD